MHFILSVDPFWVATQSLGNSHTRGMMYDRKYELNIIMLSSAKQKVQWLNEL